MGRLVVALVAGGASVLVAQRLLRLRRDLRVERALHPPGAYRHFRRLEEHGADRMKMDAIVAAARGTEKKCGV
jgi:hypothetical protein